MGLFSRKPKDKPLDSHDRAQIPQPQPSSAWSNTYINPNGVVTATRPVYEKNKYVGNEVLAVQNGQATVFNPVTNKTTPMDPWQPVKTDKGQSGVQQKVSPQVSINPSPTPTTTITSNSGGHSNTVSYSPPEVAKPKPKVEFKTADNGDLLQRAEGGNWYVAKDNPDPAKDVTSTSEGMNKRYGLGEYASPTASDALALRSEALNDQYIKKDSAASGAPAVNVGLEARSQALNEQHNLGDFAGSRTPAAAASDTGSDARSEAMNKQYSLGEYAPQPSEAQPQSGAEARSIAMNERYGLGESAPATSSAPAWHANPNWLAADAGNATTAGLEASQVLEQRAGNNGNTIFRMKDGTYQAYNPETGLHSAGTWDNSQWAGSDYASPSVSAVQSPGHGGPINGVDTIVPPGYTATETSAPVLTARELVSGFDYGSASSQPQPMSAQASAAPTVSFSPADQYSGNVDMAEIERSVAEYSKRQPDPITLPGVGDNDPTGVAGLDAGSGGNYSNPGQVAGRGRFFAE